MCKLFVNVKNFLLLSVKGRLLPLSKHSERNKNTARKPEEKRFLNPGTVAAHMPR